MYLKSDQTKHTQIQISGGVLKAVQSSLVGPAVKVNCCCCEFIFENCPHYSTLSGVSPFSGITVLMLKLVRIYEHPLSFQSCRPRPLCLTGMNILKAFGGKGMGSLWLQSRDGVKLLSLFPSSGLSSLHPCMEIWPMTKPWDESHSLDTPTEQAMGKLLYKQHAS